MLDWSEEVIGTSKSMNTVILVSQISPQTYVHLIHEQRPGNYPTSPAQSVCACHQPFVVVQVLLY
jgi:hypothetical protein